MSGKRKNTANPDSTIAYNPAVATYAHIRHIQRQHFDYKQHNQLITNLLIGGGRYCRK